MPVNRGAEKRERLHFHFGKVVKLGSEAWFSRAQYIYMPGNKDQIGEVIIFFYAKPDIFTLLWNHLVNEYGSDTHKRRKESQGSTGHF